MRYSGPIGAILIIAMLVMGIWFGCKGEKEGGGRSQYEEPIDEADEAVDALEEAQQKEAEKAEDINQ